MTSSTNSESATNDEISEPDQGQDDLAKKYAEAIARENGSLIDPTFISGAAPQTQPQSKLFLSCLCKWSSFDNCLMRKTVCSTLTKFFWIPARAPELLVKLVESSKRSDAADHADSAADVVNNHGQEQEEHEGDEREQALCQLWDLTIDSRICDLLVDLDAIPLFEVTVYRKRERECVCEHVCINTRTWMALCLI